MLALWCVPGVGRATIDRVRAHFGELRGLLSLSPAVWVRELTLPAQSREGLSRAPPLELVAEEVLERLRATRTRLTLLGEAGYPELLAPVDRAPAVLFFRGELAGYRPRVAMVGTRAPEPHVAARARGLAEELGAQGVGIVSGAARGIDLSCHLGALDAGAETWAFAGSALDRLDGAARRLCEELVERGGVFLSELPPGVCADKTSFVRRNRLISGASEVVVIVRAPHGSGALHTAAFAREQGRTVLAMPGDVTSPAAAGGNALLAAGEAEVCLGADDILARIRVARVARSTPVPASARPGPDEDLSKGARCALAHMPHGPTDFEELLARSGLDSGALTSALCELELMGLVAPRPGKRYERL